MRARWPLWLLLAALGFQAFPAAAQGPAPQRQRQEAAAERKLEAVREKIAALTAEQRALQDRRSDAERALRTADEAVAGALRELRQTEAELATGEAELARLEAEHARLQTHLADQREALAALVRSAYALGRHEQLKVLLAQDRIADLARVLAYHRYFQADRSARIRALLDELQALAELGRQVQARRETLNAVRLSQQDAIAALQTQHDQRRTLLAEVERQGRDAGARLAALGRDEKALRKLLERLRDVLADVPRRLEEGKPLAQQRGALPWPLAGGLLTAFGRPLPDGRTAEGWLIAGTAGAEVRAIAHGRVAFADWLKGYGLILILDHGEGWLSLYAHNDALLRAAGDWVRAGEPVASVGSSGGQGRPALYFELRHDSRPVDPRNWLRRR